MTELRLVVFDVDGTLVDSQADILGAMGAAFASQGMTPPERDAVLGIVGLSLDVALPRLAPDLPTHAHGEMVAAYKQAYFELRSSKGTKESAPLYPGARRAIDRLQAQPETLLGVATGKSRRGLDRLLEGHALGSVFVTQQVADHHPSKPHPSMLEAAMAETGVGPERAVMVGDTSFDMEMAKAAGIFAVGVSWGYHGADQLCAANAIVDSFDQLDDVLTRYWG